MSRRSLAYPALTSGCLVAGTLCASFALAPSADGYDVAQQASAQAPPLEVVVPAQRPDPPVPKPLSSSQRPPSGPLDGLLAPRPRPTPPPAAVPRPRRSPEPRSAPTPDSAVDEVPGKEIWSGDLETGDLSQFQDTPWNTVVARAPTVVHTPSRSGDYAAKMTIPAGASTDSFGARSEIVPDIPDFKPGDDYYFGLSMYLEDGFPVDDEWQVVTQWKSHLDGSAPLELTVKDGEFVLCGGTSHPAGGRGFCESLGPAVTGRWIDWVFHVRLSPDPASSLVQVWRDGESVLGPMRPPGGTMYPEGGSASGYMKLGYYRKSGIRDAGTIYFDDVTVREAGG